ncbi:hypothetical protein [Thermoflexus sp.]|uniref:hypothetical protein n=1 Tax=Thermoflexus sp. TaxID=1969742 RepID=UPI0033190C2A
MKWSGIGRALGAEGLEEFRETKHVHWDIEGGEKPWWFPYGPEPPPGAALGQPQGPRHVLK